MDMLKRLGRKALGVITAPYLWLIVYISMFVAFIPSAVTPLTIALQGLLLTMCFYKQYEIIEDRRVKADARLKSALLKELDKFTVKRKAIKQ